MIINTIYSIYILTFNFAAFVWGFFETHLTPFSTWSYLYPIRRLKLKDLPTSARLISKESIDLIW